MGVSEGSRWDRDHDHRRASSSQEFLEISLRTAGSKLIGIKEPIAKGLALGTSAHAIGTAKALELGEVEGAMSSLSIAVAGLMTVVGVPIMSGLI